MVHATESTPAQSRVNRTTHHPPTDQDVTQYSTVLIVVFKRKLRAPSATRNNHTVCSTEIDDASRARERLFEPSTRTCVPQLNGLVAQEYVLFLVANF